MNDRRITAAGAGAWGPPTGTVAPGEPETVIGSRPDGPPSRAPTSAGGGARIGHPLVQLILVRFREFLREPEAVFWSFVFPILLAAGLGLAFRSRPPEVVHVGVVGGSAAQALTPEALAALRADSGIALQTFASEAAADSALRTGDLALVAVSTGAAGGQRAAQYRFDLERPDARLARLLVDHAIQRGAGRQDAVGVRDRIVTEPGSRYIDFFIPGLIGFNLMGSGIWGVGFNIVTSRSKKLLKRLVATPMSRAQYLASFLISRLVFMVIEVTVLVSFGALVFGVPVRGSLVQLATIALLGALAFSGIGLAVASRARTTEGVSGLMNLVMLPMWICSGVFFSSANFPRAVQPIVQALPLTAVNDALRATMLRGAGWAAVMPELLVIVAWMAVTYTVALRIFRWR